MLQMASEALKANVQMTRKIVKYLNAYLFGDFPEFCFIAAFSYQLFEDCCGRRFLLDSPVDKNQGGQV